MNLLCESENLGDLRYHQMGQLFLERCFPAR